MDAPSTPALEPESNSVTKSTPKKRTRSPRAQPQDKNGEMFQLLLLGQIGYETQGVQATDSFKQQIQFVNHRRVHHQDQPQYFPKPKYLPQNQRNFKTCHRKEFSRKDYSKKPIERRPRPNYNNFVGAPGVPRERRQAYCFNGTAPVRMFDGTTKQIKHLKPGDILLSAGLEPTTIVHMKTSIHNAFIPMVPLDDFLITPGHPIFMNTDWYRPDELFPRADCYIDTLYNIYAQPFHEIIVGEQTPYVCSSLGGITPRLQVLDPYTDILFGSGYGTDLAKRYEWLLELPKRIPDHLVEQETEKYWKNVPLLMAN